MINRPFEAKHSVRMIQLLAGNGRRKGGEERNRKECKHLNKGEVVERVHGVHSREGTQWERGRSGHEKANNNKLGERQRNKEKLGEEGERETGEMNYS